MLATLMWIVFFVGIFALAFYQSRPRNWLIISAILLILITAFATTWVVVLFWLIWLSLFLFIALPFLRRFIFTKPILRWFLRVQPALSRSEREVLEAGGTWWEKEFFTGDPNWENLLKRAPESLNEEEQGFISGPVEKLCSMLNDWDIRQKNDLPPEVWDFIKRERFWGLGIDKKYGGLGFSAAAHSVVVAKIASRSMSAALTVMVPNALGPAIFIEFFGTDQQRDYYLPRLARGEETSCFALTSTVAGSDATSIIDNGVVCRDNFNGQVVLGIRLNLSKRYITLAPVSTLIGLAFQLFDPEHLIGDKEKVGITCALVPSHLPGIKIGPRHKPLTMSFMNGPIEGRDVFIPLEMVVGGAQGCGKGWKMLMECLALGRGISLPALACATQQVCFKSTGAYTMARRQFKRAIGEFEGVQLELAKIAGFTYLTDATRICTLRAIDSGIRPSIASAIAKYHLTELARQTVNHAMDIHGGKAIQTGPRNYLAAFYDAIPVSITVEGANILTRNLIIFGQGVVRCHPFLASEMAVAQEKEGDQQLKKFDKLLLKHIGFTVSRGVRTLSYGLTGGAFISAYRNGALKYYLQQLTRMSSAFVFLTDISLLIMGAKLKFKEALSARFGDIVSYLYMATAVIQYYIQDHEPAAEKPLLDWSVTYCLAKIQQAFLDILDNYPRKLLGGLLLSMIFPYGRVYRMPSDDLSNEVAQLMLKPSQTRDSLTRYCYSGQVPDPLAVLENVFQQNDSANKFLKSLKLQNHADPMILTQLKKLLEDQIINQEDFLTLELFLKQRMDTIEVDSFVNGREVNERTNQDIENRKQPTQHE